MAQPLIHACLTRPLLSHAFETVSMQHASMAPLCPWRHLDPFRLRCLFFLKGLFVFRIPGGDYFTVSFFSLKDILGWGLAG